MARPTLPCASSQQDASAGCPLTTLALQQDLDTLDDLRALLRDPPVSPAQRRLWALGAGILA